MENKTKYRIVYLYQLLVENSDESHPLSTVEIIDLLKTKYDIDVNRNTLGKDLEVMKQGGLPIEIIHSTQNKYYYDGQLFDLAELKVLIDAVLSSKFITEKKSQELIKRLLALTSEQNADQLRRHIDVSDRVKSENEKGYYILDAINSAIDSKKKISFQYVDYDVNKQAFLKHDGKAYIVSPYELVWDGDFYYVKKYRTLDLIESLSVQRF